MDYGDLTDAILKDAGNPKLKDPRRSLYFLLYGPHSRPSDRSITAELPHSLETLAIFAHEAGHLATNPPEWKGEYDPETIVEREFKASQWGAATIRKHLGYVPEEVEISMRRALRSYTQNPDHIVPPAAAQFLNGDTL